VARDSIAATHSKRLTLPAFASPTRSLNRKLMLRQPFFSGAVAACNMEV
jgi:hypothetical protein